MRYGRITGRIKGRIKGRGLEPAAVRLRRGESEI